MKRGENATVLALTAGAAASIGIGTLPIDLPFFPPILLVFWGALFIAFGQPSRSRPPTWLTTFCWIWIGLLAANPFWSAWVELSVWLAITLGLVPALILGAHAILASNTAWNRLELLLFGTACVVAVSMLFEYFGLGTRSDGPFLDANVAAAFLYATMLPLIYRILVATDVGLWRLALSVILFLLSAALFTSFSRGGVGSFIIALTATAAVILCVRNRYYTYRLAACLAVVIAAYGLIYHGPQTPFARGFAGPSEDSSLGARLLMWESALQLHNEAPVVGTGLGSYKILYPRYRSAAESTTSGDMAHNDYLQILAEGGLLLFSVFVLFCGWVLWTAWCLFRDVVRGSRAPSPDSIRDIGLCAAILALAVHATVNFIFYVPSVSLVVGLYAARLAGLYRKQEKPRLIGGWRLNALPALTRPLICTAAVLSIVMTATATLTSRALSWEDGAALDALSLNTPSYDLALAVSYINPLDSRALLYLARAEAASADSMGRGNLGAGLAAVALNDIESMLAVKRPDCAAQAIQGRLLETFRENRSLLQREGVWHDPVTVLEGLIDANPTCMPAYVALADLWAERGQLDRSIEVLNDATAWTHIATVSFESGAKVFVRLAEYTARAGEPVKAASILRFVLSRAPNYIPAQEALRSLQTASSAGAKN